MVPKFSKRGRGIKGAALYVLHDKGGADSSERVGFTATRNLSTDDPEMAWRLMCATAMNRDALKAAAGVRKGGRDATNFCAHISLSWHPDEQPTDADMMKAADSLLKLYGYEKLQALMVRHTDQEHQHLHIVVNLIDPETGKAAPNVHNDFQKILQPWAYQYELENGRVVCENRARSMEEKAQREAANANKAAPAHHDQVKAGDELKEGRKPWLSRAEWEAQRAAERDAKKQMAGELSIQQKAERAALMAEAKAEIRASAAAVREQYKAEWAGLYKAHRQENTDLAKEQRRLQLELDYSMKSAVARVEFASRHRELLAGEDGERVSSLQALFTPARLQEAVSHAQAQQREDLAARHAGKVEALSERVNVTRHEAQRDIWKRHNERFEDLRAKQDQERKAVWTPAREAPGAAGLNPANQNQPEKTETPTPAPRAYRTQPTPNRYEPLKQEGEKSAPGAAGSAPHSERPAPRPSPSKAEVEADAAKAAKEARAAELRETLRQGRERAERDRQRDRDRER